MFTICLHCLLVYRWWYCLFWFYEMHFINSRKIHWFVFFLLISPWTMQQMLLFMCTYTKSIYLSCMWCHILPLLLKLRTWVFTRGGKMKEMYFIWSLHKHLSFPGDTKWVKGIMVAPDARSDVRDWLPRKYTGLVKAVARKSFMQVKGNILHPFSVPPPWPAEQGFTAVNVCGFRFLSVCGSFQHENL